MAPRVTSSPNADLTLGEERRRKKNENKISAYPVNGRGSHSWAHLRNALDGALIANDCENGVTSCMCGCRAPRCERPYLREQSGPVPPPPSRNVQGPDTLTASILSRRWS
ncbi:hypothetical protein MTP99_011026 [Tenebrio molitor]|nr:hypothetical protein MTP99_011026 [Tenebrio molitor]